ncbi:MAG: hypothetical protein KF797_11315, partial [Flavobacteriales bacterium]|nr:hypothetical protein [Flavobacteriales bacterium]
EGLLDFYVKWYPEARDRTDVQYEWGHLIALFASQAHDPRKARKLVASKLSLEQRGAFFRRAGGSLRLYMLLKRMRAWMDRSNTDA